VIGPSRRIAVYACAAPVDMRKQYDTLAAIVAQTLGRDPLSGDIFVFVGKTRKRAKVLWWDGTGLCLLAKRLEKDRFAAPWKTAGDVPLRWTISELALFLEGSKLVGQMPLSPAPYERPADWPRFDRGTRE
jgi:transposase